MKNQKGITLVALIITIIVMVILAAVIIVSAVADGGIIDRAEEAMKKKERAEAEELVIASYVYKTTASMTTIGTLDLNATADAIYENLTSNGFTLMDGNVEAGSGSDILEGNKIELDIIGKHGNYGGTVTQKGLEDNLKTKDENNNIPEDIVGDEEINEDGFLPSGLVEGSKFTMDADMDGTEENWIVLYKNEGNIEVISENVMGDKKELGSSSIEDAIDSYNNAIPTLNDYCNSLIKIDNLGVRCVGSNPNNPSDENEDKPLIITQLSKWLSSARNAWNQYGVQGEIGETGEEYSTIDYNKMVELNILIAKETLSDSTEEYWLASRKSIDYWSPSATADRPSGNGSFNVCYINSTGIIDNRVIFGVQATGNSPMAIATSKYVRPVIKLEYSK